MCKKMFYLVCLSLLLSSVVDAADIQWTDLGPDHLWSTPANWDLGTVPTSADEVRIDVPAAVAPNGPVIQEGIAAEAKGIFTEAAGESTLTMTGGSLVIADYIWWGDGPNSFPIWTLSGGTVTVTNEFELGWGGGGGTLIMSGGTVSVGDAVIPTASGAFGKLFLNGGTYSVTKPGGLKVNNRGQIDITAGTLVVEGDETVKVNDLITAGQITAHGGSGKLKVDYNQSNPGKTTVTAIQKVIVLSEDFEGLPLGPNVDEALAGAQVWTDTPPAGWTIDDSGIPGIGDPATDGVTEWAGWAFANKDWWVQTAGDQRRSEFTLGQGTVAIADPDEWDDADHPKPNSANPYDTWLSTPAVDISGVETGSLQLKFDSSWRPEYDDNYHQTANITVSFDGAAPVEVLRWESNEASPNFKPDTSTNETIVVDLGNPAGAKSMVVTFGLFDAGNDWWWAIDNVEITGNPLPEPVDPGIDGLMALYALDNDVLDGSGNGNNGTIMGNPAFVEGVVGMALQFDGDDYVETGNTQNLANWTISAWVKSPAAPAAVSASGPVHREKNFQFNWNHTNATFQGAAALRVGGTWYAAKYEPVEADTWYHLTATYDGEDLKTYRDGALITTNSAPSGPPDAETGTLKLGRHATAATQYFTGTVDEAVVYSRALSYGEVRYLAGYRADTGEGDPSQVIYYSFDSVDGVVADQSGKGHDGVVTGAVTAEAGGKYNGAAKFAGGGYLDLNGPGFPAEDIPTTGMTLSAWIKCTNTGDHHALFNARAADQTWVVHPEARSNSEFRWLLRSYGGTTMFDLRAGTVTWDEWLHFAGTYDKATGKATVCINGELAKELDVTNPADIAGDWGLGARVGKNIDDARPFTGLMDEFRLFNRALSQDEIKTIMQGP